MRGKIGHCGEYRWDTGYWVWKKYTNPLLLIKKCLNTLVIIEHVSKLDANTAYW